MVELQEAEVTEQLETPPAPQTAGSLLRQAREAAGMPVSTLAEVLKVPVAKLRALEADDWQTLPDAVFTRSLALSICKALHVDAAPVMALLPKSAATQKFTAPGPGINEPFRDKAVRSVHDNPGAGGAWKAVALVALVAAGGGVWYFSQQQDLRDAVVASVQERSERAMGTSAAPAEPVMPPAAAPADVALAAPDAVTSPAPVEPAPVAAAPAAVPAAPAAVPAAPASAVETPAQNAAAPAAAAVAPAAVVAGDAPAGGAGAAAAHTLRIQARAATWIQVRAVGGKVLEQKTLNAGDVFETQAPKPLAVVIGRADAAEVQVGGAAFDIAAVARENVARFEVK